MTKYFAIYHGLVAAAPWGVAVERAALTPQFELMLLCRTEKEAKAHAERSGLGAAVQEFREKKIAAADARRLRDAE